MPKRHTAVAGHALLGEGAPYSESNQRDWYGKVGRGRCECGERSGVLPTTAARKRWHAEHKASVTERGGA